MATSDALKSQAPGRDGRDARPARSRGIGERSSRTPRRDPRHRRSGSGREGLAVEELWKRAGQRLHAMPMAFSMRGGVNVQSPWAAFLQRGVGFLKFGICRLLTPFPRPERVVAFGPKTTRRSGISPPQSGRHASSAARAVAARHGSREGLGKGSIVLRGSRKGH